MVSIFRLSGTPESELAGTLRKLTTNGDISRSPELVAIVVKASNVPDDRREIMQHLRGCLSETSGKAWHRILAGLQLLEQLLEKGAAALVKETAEGHHFDVVQRLSFLEAFEYSTDKRVEAMLRSRAGALRTEVLKRLDDPSSPTSRQSEARKGKSRKSRDRSRERIGKDDRDRHRKQSDSPRADKIKQEMVGFGSDSLPPNLGKKEDKPSNKVVLQGIVSCGHNDDTTDESEDDNEGRAGPAQPAQKGRKPVTRRDYSSDSDSSGPRRKSSGKKSSARTVPASAVEVDLLGFDAPTVPYKSAPEPPPVSNGNLLDF